MINEMAACCIANEHVNSMSAPAEGYRFELGEMHEFAAGWYFDYRIVCDLSIPESEREMFAGAPGFTVERNGGDISIVSWAERQLLGV